MKYNFVILGSSWEFYKHAYREVMSLSNVVYKTGEIDNHFFNKLMMVHLYHSINHVVKLPFRRIWNNCIIKHPFSDTSKLCFLVFYDWYCRDTNILESIRSKYPHAKIAVVFNDLIKAKTMSFSNNPIDVDKLKSLSDLIISFDFAEAKHFGLVYHALPYSKPKLTETSCENELNKKYDIYFLGQAKNRLSEIMKVYYILNRMNLKVKFILANVPIEKQIDADGISYINGVGISYSENINNIINSKCLLEIMQVNGTGYTSRTLEAIAYGKRLLTNNPSILDAPFYKPDNISYFKSSEEIDMSFLGMISSQTNNVDYNYIDKLSPEQFLEFIEEKLSC